MPYIGRFAPSPSGRLHFGSVVAAVGSYLRAKSQNGTWLIRIEDLDTPRCPQGMSDTILNELATLGLYSDKEILIQSRRLEIYQDFLQKLIAQGEAFYCSCTRAQLKTTPCTCFLKPQNREAKSSIRFKPLQDYSLSFHDKLLGQIHSSKPQQFVTLKRSDGIIAYNLACVIDDALSGVTEVVRGRDLLNVTTIQIKLFESLNFKTPAFLHLPLALTNLHDKLSKQNHAPAILDLFPPAQILIMALEFLGQETSALKDLTDTQSILKTAIANFKLENIPKKSSSISF